MWTMQLKKTLLTFINSTFTYFKVQEVIVDYTKNCKPLSGQGEASAFDSCRDFLAANNNTGKICDCEVHFELEEDFRVCSLQDYTKLNLL